MTVETQSKVLVVEDDHEIRESICDVLQDEGYEVVAAENGAVALELLQAMENLPSVILLDISMPVLDGYGFRSEQAKHPRLAAIPTVMVSADGNVKQKAGRAGLADFLRKPIELTDLLEIVGRLCR